MNVAFAVARHSHPPKALATADTVVVVVAAVARTPIDSTCVVAVALVVATFHADTWDSVVVSSDHVRSHRTCWLDSCIVVAFDCGVVRIVADLVVDHRTRGCCKEPYYRYITSVVAYSVVVVASLVAAAAATHIVRVHLYIALALMAFVVVVVVVVGRDHDWADANCRDWHADCMRNVQDVVLNRNCAVVVAFAFD